MPASLGPVLQWNWGGILFVVFMSSLLPILEFWGWRRQRHHMRKRLMQAVRHDKGSKWSGN